MTIKKDSELEIFSLNEKRNRQIDEALIRNQEKAKKIGGVAIPDLGSIIKNQVDRAKVDNSDMFDGLEIITNDKTRKNFERSFSNTETLFARINLTPPTPEQFEKAGVDFEYLANEYERMYYEHLIPSLVITPTLRLAPTKNDLVPVTHQCWNGLYDNLIKDKTIVNNLHYKKSGSASIRLGEDVLQNNEHLFKNELNLVTNNNIHYVTIEAKPTDTKADTIIWTIALIPSTSFPQELNRPYSDFKNANDPISSEHITISQYLTYQACSLQSGDNILDEASYTWLQSSCLDSSKALYGEWVEGRIHLNYWEVARQSDNMGVRLPVWG